MYNISQIGFGCVVLLSGANCIYNIWNAVNRKGSNVKVMFIALAAWNFVACFLGIILFFKS